MGDRGGVVTLLGMDHVQMVMPIGSEAEAQARSFYGDVLGLAEVPKPEPLRANGGLWFTGAGIHLHLGVLDPFVPQRKAHLAFRVADLDAALIALVGAGVTTRRDTRVPDMRRAYIDDCFGNRMELIHADDVWPGTV